MNRELFDWCYALTTRYRAARNEGRGYIHGWDSRQVLYTWCWVMRSTLLEWRPDDPA